MKWRNLDQGRDSLLEEYRAKNPYEVLRVSRNASFDEIHRAYRDIMKVYHPDVADEFMHAVNAEIAKIVNGAYESILRERNERR